MQQVQRTKRSQLTLTILLYGVLDVSGMTLFASGAVWLAQDQLQFLPGFPSSTSESIAALIGGIVVMFWAATRILRELLKQSDKTLREGQ